MTVLTMRRSAAVGALILAAAGGLVATQPRIATAATSEGMVCEYGTAGALATGPTTFDLTATDGYITTPDGNSIYMWGYGDDANSFQLPAPNLCVTAGQSVTIVLHNVLPEPVSIVVPGLTGMQANGAPAQPQTDANHAVTSLVQAAPANTGTMTYTFTPTRPGTYVYESGTDVDKQVQMGLAGALVVRPAANPDYAYADAGTKFNPSHEYIYVLSEVDPALHLAVEQGKPFPWNSYQPRYFMINGRSMPDTVAPNFAAWLPSQPYGALVHIEPYDATTEMGQRPALIRYVNVGTVNYPFHPHGADERVIGIDARQLVGAADGKDLSYDKFLVDVAPGQTVDAEVVWKDVEHWDPVTNPIPVPLPGLQDQIVGPGNETWFSESPYLGDQNSLPTGVTNHNECGEYYHIAHSHALMHSTNYGASFGGMMTLDRIDPPGGCPPA